MEIHDTVLGPYFCDSKVDFYGLIHGNAYVRAGGVLDLHGRVTGDLHVLSGGAATIHGTVSGCVENTGARVEIFGTVGTVRNHEPRYPAFIGPGAVIDTEKR